MVMGAQCGGLVLPMELLAAVLGLLNSLVQLIILLLLLHLVLKLNQHGRLWSVHKMHFCSIVFVAD